MDATVGYDDYVWVTQFQKTWNQAEGQMSGLRGRAGGGVFTKSWSAAEMADLDPTPGQL